jgi:hypothetical protein
LVAVSVEVRIGVALGAYTRPKRNRLTPGGSGVANYQGRITTNEMMAKAHFVCDSLEDNPTQPALLSARDALVKQGILTQDETTKVSYSAVTVYCPQFDDLTPIS